VGVMYKSGQIEAPLSKQKWEQVSIHEVYYTFLKGEFEKCFNSFKEYVSYAGQVVVVDKESLKKQILEDPDFGDESQNAARSALLAFGRNALLSQIPQSTVWYKVSSLRESHFDELRVIGRCGWDDAGDDNELLNVAKRKSETLTSNPSDWVAPILWGHTEEGPFTVIEGNHRLVAYASLQNRPELNILIYVGLSDEWCFWHLPDPY